MRGEDDPPTGDAAVDEAFDGLGATFDFYWDAYQRSGIDGAGAPLLATVHYGRDYDNAFWNGERMVFGDGDGEVFVGFTGSLSVIAHELTHGVTESRAASTTKANRARSTSRSPTCSARSPNSTGSPRPPRPRAGSSARASSPTPSQGDALRSLKAPGTAYDDDVLGKDPQPAHMDDYVQTRDDNGGVHINSGIPNHAFYLAADAARRKRVGARRAGLVSHADVGSPCRPLPTSARSPLATVTAAEAEYGEESEEVDAVRSGLDRRRCAR